LLQVCGHVHHASPGMQSGVQGQSAEVNSDEHSALSNSTSEYAPAHVKHKTPMKNIFFISASYSRFSFGQNPARILQYIQIRLLNQ